MEFWCFLNPLKNACVNSRFTYNGWPKIKARHGDSTKKWSFSSKRRNNKLFIWYEYMRWICRPNKCNWTTFTWMEILRQEMSLVIQTLRIWLKNAIIWIEQVLNSHSCPHCHEYIHRKNGYWTMSNPMEKTQIHINLNQNFKWFYQSEHWNFAYFKSLKK